MVSGDDDRRDGGDNRDAWTSERVYRALIRLYPEEVRRRYAEEMVLYFGDHCREEWHSGGPMALALLWARTLPDLILTALKERGALLRSNAYLPLEPAIVTRWAALCALLGGSLGVSYFLLYPLLFGALMSILTGDVPYYGSDPFTMFFTNSLWLGALSFSSLGLIGLYGAVVQRSGRPGLLAGTGALFSAGSAALWLATSGYAAIGLLASGSALFAPFEWLAHTGTFVIPVAMLFWFVGFLLLGIAAFRRPLPVRLRVLPLVLFALIVSSYLLGGYYLIPFGKTNAILLWFVGFLLLGITIARQPLPVRLRVLPLALFALIVPSYLLGHYLAFATAGPSGTATIVMGLAQSLPFVGIALLGWVLLKAYDDADEPLAVSGASAESIGGAAHGMTRSVIRTTSGAWGAARSATMSGARRAIERLKRWLVPSTLGGWVLAALMLVLVLCAWAYSARDDLYKTYQGMQPGADQGPAFAASEKLELTKTAGGARVTVNWVYAEEQYVSIGYEVEDLQDGRRAGGHPAELQPLLVFEEPTGRAKKELEKYGLGIGGVGLTDQSGTDFRMVDNMGETAGEPENMAKGPLQNMAAFKPEGNLEPGEGHRFRLEIPLLEQPVVPLEEKQLPPEPFPGEPFVFEFEIPVHAVPVVEVGQKVRAKGVTLTLDRVLDSPGRPQAVVCYELPDDEHHWTLHGGKGTLEGGHNKSGWTGSASITYNPPGKCQNLMLVEGPLEGHSSVEVAVIEGYPDCPSGNVEALKACDKKIESRRIRGPWRFEFEMPNP